METESNRSYVKDKEVVVKAVQVETRDMSVEDVKKIRFVTDVGDITWKPKVYTTKIINGLQVKFRDNMKISQVPKKILDISEACMTTGKVRMRVEYSTFDTEDGEGQPVMYRFINGYPQIERWVFLDKEVDVSDEEDVHYS